MSDKKKYRIGTRQSPLALKQVDEIRRALNKIYPAAHFEIVGIDTYGDKDKITPISEMEGSDFFTREIDIALLEGKIDFAVHSAKDLPDKILEGLELAAITESIDLHDALVSKGNFTIDKLPKGAKIAASSLRRKFQLKKYRKDFQIVDVRGNIQERLAKLDEGSFDALIIAACALVRLGLEVKITQRIPLEILAPHPLQGALAVITKEDGQELINWLKVLNAK